MHADATLLEDRRPPAEQARAWIVRLKSGEATRGDLDAFAAWRAGAGNEAAYRDALAMWRMLGTAIAQADPVPPRVSPQILAAYASRRRVLTGAGMLAIGAIVLPLAIGYPLTPAGATVLETRKGERRAARIGDGLSVDLNTDTRVVSWVEQGVRQLRLDRGEAVVAVRDGPLRATVGDTEVLANSARFLLRSVDDGMPNVLCLAGSVEVRTDAGSFRLATRESIGPADAEARHEPADEVAGALEWRRGVLVFNARRAGDVVAELNRYRGGRVFLGGVHSDVRISGVIRLDRADAAIDHIARSLGLRVVRMPAGIVLLRG
jgi:transmembrane sensor